MRRILFLNRSYWPDSEATGQLLTDLCESLASDFDVHVVCGQPNSVAGDVDYASSGTVVRHGVTIHRLRHTTWNKRVPAGRLINLVSFARATAKYLRRSQLAADVVIAETDPFLLPIVAAKHASQSGAKLICYLQDIYPDIALALGKAKPGLVVNRLRTKLIQAYQQADCMIVLSGCMQRRLTSAPWSIDATKFSIIPNWADCDSIAPIAAADNRFRQRHAVDDRFVVMHSGNMGLSQRLDVLLAAVKQPAWPANALLMLVGDGAARRELEAQAAELPEDRVRLLPYQPRKSLAESLSAADLHVVSMDESITGCLSPSKFYGILAAGRPTLAITAPGTEVYQLVRDQQLGWCCQPGDPAAIADCVAAAAGDREQTAAAGRRARRLALAEYHHDVIVNRFEQLITSLFPAPPAQNPVRHLSREAPAR